MLTSQLDILEQARTYLKSTTKEDYVEIISPNFMSPAGAHIRHIIDHYQSLITGLTTGVVDYDVRLRGNKIEQDPQLAINTLDDIAIWMNSLSNKTLNQTLSLSTEICTHSKKVYVANTTVARELIFVGSHAVHHFAMITQICFAQSAKNNTTCNANVTFGIAPATATFLREKAQ